MVAAYLLLRLGLLPRRLLCGALECCLAISLGLLGGDAVGLIGRLLGQPFLLGRCFGLLLRLGALARGGLALLALELGAPLQLDDRCNLRKQYSSTSRF